MNRIYKIVSAEDSESILIILLILSEKFLSALDLPVFQFHRRRATENGDRNAQLTAFGIDFFDHTGLILERAVGDLHRFAYFKADFRFHLFLALLHLGEHAFYFRLSHGDGLVLGPGKPDHAGRVAD